MSTISLEQIRIASPCTARWEDMIPVGDGATARHCGQCGLDVHDLSAMTREEAERFVDEGTSGARLCVRLYKRADGRVITRDCPVGVRSARAAMLRMAGRAVAALAVVFTGGAMVGARERSGPFGMRVGWLEPFATIRAWLSPRPPPTPQVYTMGSMISAAELQKLVKEVGELREQELKSRQEAAGEACIEPIDARNVNSPDRSPETTP